MSSDAITAQPPPGGVRRCPHCGAPLREPTATRCWLCEAEITPQAGGGEADDKELLQLIKRPEASSPAPHLAILIVLLVLVAIGLLMVAPGLLVVFAVVATPALIHATIASRRQEAGGPVQPRTAVGAFFSTLGAIILVGVAAIVSFFAACFAVCLGTVAVAGERNAERFLGAFVLIGVVVSLMVTFLIIRALVRRRS